MKIAMIMATVAMAQARELAIYAYRNHECTGPWSAYSLEEDKCSSPIQSWPFKKANCAVGITYFDDSNCTLVNMYGGPHPPGQCFAEGLGSFKLMGCEGNAGGVMGGGMVQVAALVGVSALLLL